MAETVQINHSLFVLRKCIAALSKRQEGEEKVQKKE